MPPCCWRSRPAPCPPRLGGRRPRRRLFLPPPPEGRPGPAFILFSCVSCIQSARKADANLLSLLAALWMVPCATHNQLARKPQFKWNSDRKSTRLNSSHSQISYAVFCLKKKKKNDSETLSSLIQRCDWDAP